MKNKSGDIVYSKNARRFSPPTTTALMTGGGDGLTRPHLLTYVLEGNSHSIYHRREGNL